MAVTITRETGGGARLALKRLRFLRWLLPMLPALVLMGVFFFGPIAWTFYIAFTDLALTGASVTHFVGLDNFRQMFSQPSFWQSVWLSVVYLIGSAVIGQAVLGFVLALLMQHRKAAVRSVIGAIIVTAWVVPEIVAAFVWYTALTGNGTLNSWLIALHLPRTDWLYSQPMGSVIVANIWRGTAFSMLVFSAGLTSVPSELLESASIDGANYLRRLRYVILPLMKTAISTDLVLITLQTLSGFTLIYAMTAGGPGTSSSTLPVYIYQEAFKFYHLGYGTAISLILLLIGAVASIIYLRVLRVEAD
jgi:multiple sugar transport system permease protein